MEVLDTPIDWDEAKFVNLKGEIMDALHFGANNQEPVGFSAGTRILLRPIIYELKVLTKERGLQRMGEIVNWAQERVITEAERQLYEYGQIRMVVYKARQMGLSTVIEAIIFTLSMMYRDFQSLIISHESESSEHILGMTKRYWTTYPFRKYHDEQYSGRKQLAWSDIGSNIVVATAKNMGAGRSKTLHALHASEVAFWDKPEELVTGLRQAIPSIGLTAIFYESTANGVGNFFHTVWLDAESGRSEYVGLFFPWFLDPHYTAKNIPMRERSKYAALLEPDKEEQKLIGMGVTVDRLLWRRWAIINLCQNSVDKFKQEYPATPHEGFLATGRNVFNMNDLLQHYQPMKPKVGRLERVNGSVRFTEDSDGPLRIYRTPAKDKSWGIYQIGADPTHTTVGDNAVAQVISRRTLEQCATFSAHMDPIEFGKQLYMLGEYYNWAELAPEVEGPGYGTVAVLMTMLYPYVFQPIKDLQEPGSDPSQNHGWRTNVSTKHEAIGQLINHLAQPLVKIGTTQYGLVLHDEETYKELRDYVTDEKGGFKNGKGSDFDDTVMGMAICVTTHVKGPILGAYTRDESHLTLVRDISSGVNARLKSAQPGPAAIQIQVPEQPNDPFDDGKPAWLREMEQIKDDDV